jgi:hypothetical protein
LGNFALWGEFALAIPTDTSMLHLHRAGAPPRAGRLGVSQKPVKETSFAEQLVGRQEGRDRPCETGGERELSSCTSSGEHRESHVAGGPGEAYELWQGLADLIQAATVAGPARHPGTDPVSCTPPAKGVRVVAFAY